MGLNVWVGLRISNLQGPGPFRLADAVIFPLTERENFSGLENVQWLPEADASQDDSCSSKSAPLPTICCLQGNDLDQVSVLRKDSPVSEGNSLYGEVIVGCDTWEPPELGKHRTRGLEGVGQRKWEGREGSTGEFTDMGTLTLDSGSSVRTQSWS